MRQEDLPKANAKCVVCGAPYYMCKKCIELRDRGIYGWRLFCDGTQCYQIKLALDDFINKITNKKETKEMIESLSVYPEVPNMISPYKEAYDQILEADNKVVVCCVVEDGNVVDAEVVEEKIEKQLVYETQPVKIQTPQRNKQIKKHNAKSNKKH